MFPGYSPGSLLGHKRKAWPWLKASAQSKGPKGCRLTCSEQVICVDFSVGVRYEERGMCVASADSLIRDECTTDFAWKHGHGKAGFGFLGQRQDCGSNRSNLIPNSDCAICDMNLTQTLGLPEGGLGTQLVALRLPELILQRSDGQSLPVN